MSRSLGLALGVLVVVDHCIVRCTNNISCQSIDSYPVN
jgi:hypothetical protein